MGVKPPVWAGAVVNVSLEVLNIVVLAGILIGVFAGVIITVLMVLGGSAGVMLRVGVNMLVGVEINVVPAMIIVLKFVVKVSYSVNVLSDVVATLWGATSAPVEAFSC